MTLETLAGIMVVAVVSVVFIAFMNNQRSTKSHIPIVRSALSVFISIPIFIYAYVFAFLLLLQFLYWLSTVSAIEAILNFIIDVLFSRSGGASWFAVLLLFAISWGVGWICHIIIGAICKVNERTAYLSRSISSVAVCVYFVFVIILCISTGESFRIFLPAAVASAFYSYYSIKEYKESI